MIENISILGSTGSIGTQTLEVLKHHGGFKVGSLTAGENITLLCDQIRKFSPSIVSVKSSNEAKILADIFQNGLRIEYGDFGNVLAATMPEVSKVVVATPGLPGIKPAFEALKAKKTLALATKEVLVVAGEIIMDEAKKNNIRIFPIDSEHSAILQCLNGHKTDEVSKIYLTCSGGPFRGKNLNDLKNVDVKSALNHPSWKMGKKITVDSATLMNKGFEVIEAHRLFGIPLEKIEVIVHPQSVIHSAVEFKDGSVIAQMGAPDMRIPIQYALFFPKRMVNNFKRLSFRDYPSFSFEEPDLETFRCLTLALESARLGGTYPAALNAANDISVDSFLKGRLPFFRIPEIIEKTLDSHEPVYNPNLETVFEADKKSREFANSIINLI